MANEQQAVNAEIPRADYAVVGGSGTLSSNFPANLPDEDVKILADNLISRHRTVGALRCASSASARSAC